MKKSTINKLEYLKANKYILVNKEEKEEIEQSLFLINKDYKIIETLKDLFEITLK